MKYITTLFISVFLAQTTSAMVFDMSKEKFGSYLRGNYSPWANADTPFSQSSGTNMAFSDSFTNLLGYEFGVLYNTQKLTWRFGLEMIQPPQLSDLTGKDATSRTQYYTLTSSIAVVIPKIGLEVNLKTWKESRFWGHFEYGLANLTLQNSYKFNAAGSAHFGGLSDFREEIKANQAEYSAGLGVETLMSDATTISLELGYRFLQFSTMTHNLAATNFQGAQTVGGAAKRNDGTTARDLNMTGPYAGVSLRIWIY